MTTLDIERLEQHLAANLRLRQVIVFGSMVLKLEHGPLNGNLS